MTRGFFKVIVIVFSIIIICDPKPDCYHKNTVYYWKYTAYHIGQPAPTIPAQDLEVVA